jgi:phasin family protein
MADGKQPFADFDFTKAFAAFKIPGVDVQALITMQRKNLEAFTLANQLVAEAVQEVGRRQMELAQRSMVEAKALLRDIAQPGAPEERLAKNAELAKQAFENGLAQAQEFTEIVANAQAAAFNVISKRVTESMNEMPVPAMTNTTP